MDDGFDEAKARAFAARMVGVLNGGSLALMLSVGHQAGIFDVLAGLPPSTSAAVASAAKLQERYVREWLGAMVVAGIVEYDPSARTYRLPPEHAAALTRAAGPRNLAGMMRFIPVLAGVEAEILACFRDGGGVPYSSFPAFQRLMGEGSRARFDADLIDRVLPFVPGLPERLAEGIDVADVGCGSGHAINVMATAFPASRFTGYDISPEGIGLARAEAEALGLTNARFEVRDAATLGEPGSFDFVTTFDSVHDQAKPADVLAGIAAMLRPGGWYLCCDMGLSSNLEDNVRNPLAPFLYTVSTLHCMTVSLADGGAGLGAAWGEQLARQMITEAGLEVTAVHRIENDVLNAYFVCRKPA